MPKYLIESWAKDPATGVSLPCDEKHADLWYVVDGPRIVGIYDDRGQAEDLASRLNRASRFTWGDDDVEHH